MGSRWRSGVSTVAFTQVLIYSGQLDVIVAAPLTERFLPTVNWTGAAEYKTAPRFHWKVQPSDTEVAGYVRQVGEFYQVSVCFKKNKQHSHIKVCLLKVLFICRSSYEEEDTFCRTTSRKDPLI